MSDERNKSDTIEGQWQPIGVVSLEKEPKPKPAVRSLRNAVCDIGGYVLMTSALWCVILPLILRDLSIIPWAATSGGIIGLVFGIRKWMSRPLA
jgi:hypothetical protein